MKKFRLSLIVAVFGAILAGIILFQVSQDVQNAEAELRYLQKKSVAEQETIRVLKAEWAYLNQPERLEMLSGKYLDMKAPDIDQIKEAIDSLPEAVMKRVAIKGTPAVLTPHVGSAAVPVPRPSVKPSRFQNKGFQDLLDNLTPAAGGVE